MNSILTVHSPTLKQVLKWEASRHSLRNARKGHYVGRAASDSSARLSISTKATDAPPQHHL